MSDKKQSVTSFLTDSFAAVAGYCSMLVGLTPEPAMIGVYQVAQDARTIAVALTSKRS